MGIAELLALALKAKQVIAAADETIGIAVSAYQKIRGSGHSVDDAAAIAEMDGIAADYDVRIARAKKNAGG